MSPSRSRTLVLAALLLLGGPVRGEEPLPPGAIARLGSLSFRQPFQKTPAVHVAVASGGKVIATRSDTRTLRLWDDKGQLLHALDQAADVSAFAFSADGKQLASAGGGSVWIWDVAGGRQTAQWQAHDKPVSSLAFSPDGLLLATGSGEINPPDNAVPASDSVRLWEPGSGKEVRRFDKLDNVLSVAFSPDGKMLAAGQRKLQVFLWDPATGKELRQLPADAHELSRLFGLAFSPDSKTLAVGNRTITRLWDVVEGKELRQFGKPVAEESTALNNDETLAFSPDGSVLATGGNGVRLWEAATGRKVRAFAASSRRLSSIAFLDDKRIVTGGGGDQLLHLWDAANGKELPTAGGHRDAIQCAAFSPNGKWIITGGTDRQLLLWDAATGKVARSFSGHNGGVTAVAFTADGARLASADSGGVLRIWETATARELLTFKAHAGWVTVVAFSPDGKALATAGRDGKLQLYDITRNYEKEIHQFPKHQEGATAVAFSVDGKFLASGSGNGQVRLWKMDLGQEVGAPEATEEDDPLLNPFAPTPMPTAPSPVLLLVFSPSGKQLTSWLDSGAIVIWDAASRKQLRRFDGPSAGGTSAAFSFDGKTLAARDKNNQITLREAANGQERLLLQGHPDRDFLWALAFAPDGRRLVSVGNDTTALVWDVTGRGNPLPQARLTAKELDVIWGDLAHEKGDRAYRGIWSLVAASPDALPFLQEKLKPVPVDPMRVEKLIADLDSNVFVTRQKAIAELEELSELAEDAMKKALAAKPPLEVSQRLEKLLAKVEKERFALNPHRLRILRASETLEHIGSDEAKKVLEGLAEAPPELRLTEEVKREIRASLDRLNRRAAKP